VASVVAVVPLSWQYYRDSRDAEIQTLASKLEFFAERGASWLDVPAITRITTPEHKATDDTWRAGEMMHSQLFGGRVEGTD
jgi:hypothetical protein